MSFLSRLFDKPKSDDPFIGQWTSDYNDDQTKSLYGGNITMTFAKDGTLTYAVYENDKVQIINLIYSVDGNILVTDQPSSPGIERTEFQFVNDNILILKYDGAEGKFIKSSL